MSAYACRLLVLASFALALGGCRQSTEKRPTESSQQRLSPGEQTVLPCGTPPGSGPFQDLCTVTRTGLPDGREEVRIDKPFVDRDHAEYLISVGSGDEVTFQAGGCVQTGTSWRRFVNPVDPAPFNFITLFLWPGAQFQTVPVEVRTLDEVVGKTMIFPYSNSGYLKLMYRDTGAYADNGYYNHDDGLNGQCALDQDGGPAYIILTIKYHDITQPPPQLPYAPYDLVPGSNRLDHNGFYRDPSWGWQVASGTVVNYDTNNKAVTQTVSTNPPPSHVANVLGLCGSGKKGHDNWFNVTYTGRLRWINWEKDLWADDDYNILLYPSKINGQFRGVAQDNLDGIKLEFNHDETIDHYEDISFWHALDELARNGDPHTLIDNHLAVVVGTMGIDLVHGASSEIHPVLALAVRMFEPFDPVDDVWAFFARNLGNEGQCSTYRPILNRSILKLQLPRPSPVGDENIEISAVPELTGGTIIGHNASDRVLVDLLPNEGVVMRFEMPLNFDDPAYYAGTIHFRWPTAGPRDAGPPPPPLPPPPPVESDESPFEALLDGLSPEQRASYMTIANVLLPPALTLVNQVVTVGAATQALPFGNFPLTPSPDGRSVLRLQAQLGAFCSVFDGEWPGDPTACSGIVPPVVGVSGGSAGKDGWLTSTATISLTPTDLTGRGIGHVEYSFDGTSWQNYQAPITLPAGVTTLYYRWQYATGEYDFTRQRIFKIDPLPPSSQATLTAGGGGLVLAYTITDPTPGSGPSGMHTIVHASTGNIEAFTPGATGTVQLATLCATTVEYWAEDVAGNQQAHVFGVDSTPPVFSSVPGPLSTTVCTNFGIGSPIANDECGAVTLTNNAPAKYPIGTTVVTWTATDPSGNTITATQQITATLGDDASCCPTGTNIILGTSGSNVLLGTSGADCILGRGGDDVIEGRDGNDFVSGGAGNDTINAGLGNDSVWGGDGNDVINGGTGNDAMDGGGGNDVCNGGPGTNTVLSCEVAN